MGKKTLYHPVSVNVLRGALEFCGIVPGRLVQLSSNFERAEACYRFEIVKLPKNLWGHNAAQLTEAVNGCFAADVQVESISINYSRIVKRSVTWIWIRCHAALPFEENVFEDIPPEDVYDRPNKSKGTA